MERNLYIETFGCQMNHRDSERLLSLLSRHGYRPVDRPELADLVIVNTCSVREKPEQKVLSLLGRYRRLKEGRPRMRLAVGGCMAQLYGEELLRRSPGLDLVFGTHNLTEVPGLISRLRDEEAPLCRTDPDVDLRARFEHSDRYLVPRQARAFVTVMEGCDLRCTFCIVPRVRGREVSRLPDEILKEVEELAARGVREVILLGQTVNAYGKRPGEIPFAELLRKIGATAGIERIRFTSSHPLFVGDDLVEAFGTLEKLCPHLHLPVQSGSDRVLQRMRRRVTRRAYVEKVAALRRARSDIAISTDLIVGFPGETDADFHDTLSLMGEIGFDDSFAFKYSPRPETAAAVFPDQVKEEVASRRLEQLLELQNRIALGKNRLLRHAVVPVLVEGWSKSEASRLTGRTPHNKVVNFVGSDDWIGRSVPVRVTEAFPHALRGEPADKGMALPLLQGSHRSLA